MTMSDPGRNDHADIIGTGRPDDRTTGRPDDRTTGAADGLTVPWFKASASNGSGGNCVELAAFSDGDVGVRDSKDPDGPHLRFTRAEMAAFMDGLIRGEFDDVVGRP